MRIEGKVWRFQDHVDTDLIIPARYLNVSDGKELAAHCFVDIRPDFAEGVQEGDVLVAGKNFGCGSSREHAPLAIRETGIRAVIAESFARIFYRNAFNTGLLILVSPEAADDIKSGDDIEVEPEKGLVKNLTTGKEYESDPIPPFMRELLDEGGLMKFMMERA